jgi:hypothetical protein
MNLVQLEEKYWQNQWLISELEELRSAVNAGLGDMLTQPQLLVQDAPSAED